MMLQPVGRRVTEHEMRAHIAAWPRPLVRDFGAICEPPFVAYKDFTLGPSPMCIVASYSHQDWLDDDGKVCEPRDTGWAIYHELPA